jgi:hypothetical protein
MVEIKLPPSKEIKAFLDALSVETLLKFSLMVWASLMVPFCFFLRPDVITALAPHYWLLSAVPMFILLCMVWVSIVVLLWREAHPLPVPNSPAHGSSASCQKEESPRPVPPHGGEWDVSAP